ncbi:AMP-binding protein [Nostoc sp.]
MYCLIYWQLEAKARAIAPYLQSQLSIGERVLLLYPQGLEAIAAFFGCLYAGVVAIREMIATIPLFGREL